MTNPDTPPKPAPPEQPIPKGLDETACSSLVAALVRIETLENALRLLMGDVNHLGHWIPDPCRDLVNAALESDRGTNEREGNHYGPPTRYVVERRRADLDGEWKQVGNEYSTLERAEKEARWERSSRKGMQTRIIPIPENAESIHGRDKT